MLHTHTHTHLALLRETRRLVVLVHVLQPLMHGPINDLLHVHVPIDIAQDPARLSPPVVLKKKVKKGPNALYGAPAKLYHK